MLTLADSITYKVMESEKNCLL